MIRRRRRFRTPCVICLGSLGFGFIFVIMVSLQSSFYYDVPPPSLNYFVEKEEIETLGYLISTPKCHILNIPPWHSSILHLVANSSVSQIQSHAQNCRNEHRAWTYVRDKKLIINETAIHSSGYSRSSVYCCYRPFHRVGQSPTNYNLQADSEIQFSKDCKPLSYANTTLEEDDEFIRVLCWSKYWPWSSDVIYRTFHATPIPKEKTIQLKREKIGSLPLPKPNVVLLGIDSMSRLSFERNMPLTRNYLKNEMKAVELQGYTKVGENTFPNLIPIMTGHKVENVETLCNISSHLTSPLDSCPFIWKEFEERGYLTAFVEDVPFLAIYNYGKLGFRERPTDFYLRPFMLGLYQQVPRKSYYYLDCIGPQTVDEMMLQYIQDVLQVGRRTDLPVFIKAWLTNLAHGDLNGAQVGDSTYLEFLQSTDMNNTILVFMSDHGYRYGPIRQTFAGWYEDKLPTFYIYLPESIKKQYPHWYIDLQENGGKLTSPFDLHSTLNHILTTFSSKPELGTSSHDSSNLTGVSMFSPIPSDRRCTEAGIPDNYCACSIPRKLDLEDKRLINAASKAIEYLNNFLPKDKCSSLTLSEIQAGGILLPEQNDCGKVIVAFTTSPGDFLFEATVNWTLIENGAKYTVLGEPLRMSKVKMRDVSCVKEDLEKFCYCSSTKVN